MPTAAASRSAGSATGTTTAWTTVTRPRPSAVSRRPLLGPGLQGSQWRALPAGERGPTLSATSDLFPPQISTPAPQTASSARTTGASPTAGSVTGTTTAGTVRTSPMPRAQVWNRGGPPWAPLSQGGGGAGSQAGEDRGAYRKESTQGVGQRGWGPSRRGVLSPSPEGKAGGED